MFIFIYILLISSVLAKYDEYKGYRVYNVEFLFQAQEENLYKIKSDLIDFWKKPSFKYGVIGKAMVPPSHFEWFENMLVEIEVKRDVFIEDVYEFLNKKGEKSTRNRENDLNEFNFEAFHRYDVILSHLYNIQEAYANSPTEFEVIQYGITAQNRPLVYVKLTNTNNESDNNNSNGSNNKPVVIIEACTNPRAWITIPSALNVVNNLLEGDQGFLDEIVWIIIPVMNPDGYEYTHTNLRLWTKSMSLNNHLGFICPGVNLNRNFNINWLISDSSSSPCSHIYAGIDPFSEIETQMIRHLLEEFNPTLYISLENNGKFLTYPWAFEKAATGLFRRHYLLGFSILNSLDGYVLDSRAIAVGDRESGTSTDYARVSAKALYTFNIGIETGEDGVIIEEDSIKILVEDVWSAVATAAIGII